MYEHTAYLGRRDDGARVWVHIELRTQTPRQGETSTEHEPITEPYLELAIQGSAVSKGRREVDEAGQMRIDPESIVPADGWTTDDLRSLVAIWDRWHLNGMNGACAHMPVDARARWKAGEEVVCEAGSGYRYGSAWLSEPLPAEVVTEVRRLMALPTGNVPEYVA